MRKEIKAYKFRESRLLQVIQNKDEQINSLQSTRAKLTKANHINSLLKRENKELITNNRKSVSKLTESISTKENKLNVLQDSISTQKKSIVSLKEELVDSRQQLESLQSQVRMCNKETDSLRESIRNKDKNISNLKRTLNGYEKQVSEQKDTIQNLESTVCELQENLQTLQSDMNLSEQEFRKNSGQMELEINSYTSLMDQLHGKVQTLQNQLTESTTQKDKLANQVNHLVETLHKYQQYYVNTKSKQLGVDPNMVKKFVNTGTSVTQVDKLVEDLRDTKDRYAKLPFSESLPKGVVVESSSIQKADPEEERLTKFCEQIVNGK